MAFTSKNFDAWITSDLTPYSYPHDAVGSYRHQENAAIIASHSLCLQSEPVLTPANLNNLEFLGNQKKNEFFQKNPHSDLWKQQSQLALLIGPGDARFPAERDVLALEFPEDVWLHHLFLPDRDWHALANAGVVLRLMIPSGHRLAAGISRLAQRFPQTKFLIDAFRHGPASRANWQAQVCLADQENVWISTLGMVPGPAFCWPEQEQINEALYFTVGEVGAGKLLFASGQTWEESKNFDAENWLERVPFLDPAQRALIRNENAWELF